MSRKSICVYMMNSCIYSIIKFSKDGGLSILHQNSLLLHDNRSSTIFRVLQEHSHIEGDIANVSNSIDILRIDYVIGFDSFRILSIEFINGFMT